MAIEDDDKPRKKVTHEIGQDLSLLSVEELTERIALMTSEIERLQVAMTKKRASKEAANIKARPTEARRRKASRAVTLKHLAAALAEEHQLTKRAGEALLGDLG